MEARPWAAPDDEVHTAVNELERPIAFKVGLVDECRFSSGVVHLHYRTTS